MQTMNDPLRQYKINSNWRYHVLEFIKVKTTSSRSSSHNGKRKPFTILDYCNGNQEYERSLTIFLEFMEEEERLYFYKCLATECIDEARRTLNLLIARKDNDPAIRMPLLRDVVISYSKPFKESYGRLNKKYRLTEEVIGIPSPTELHKKILSDRDQRYVHCDLSVKTPRSSKWGGFSVKAGYNWMDYENLLNPMADLMDSALSLIRQFTKQEGMNDSTSFFQRFEDADALTAREPDLLNQIYGYQPNK